ncbi:prepilin peptidase [Vibrio aquaticus]|uniref:Prepilin peptidase n=1 Tax=Vibrio aquaticus TaxID=2496559 RepID=A0A432CVG8_9VIBR|nr:prepilin peptidase [Vibrio aquaticus]RTZ14455.1 prepilin peptidase [Vibrio aquaticus]
MNLNLWWLVALAAMALIASYQDVRQRKIPNGVVTIIALLGVFFVFFYGRYTQLYLPIVVLVVGALLFKFNIMAAGDSKLLASFSLMISPHYFLLTVCLILIAGGTLAITQWILSRVTGNAQWVTKGVPYGLPICLGSLLGIAASL